MDKKWWMELKRREKIENPTRAEMAMRLLLRKMKVAFIEEKRGTKDGICRFYDFFLRKPRIVIEVDGGYHCDEIDKPKEDEIKRLYPEWTLIRFKNEDVLNETEKVRALIKLAIQDQAWNWTGVNKVKSHPSRNIGNPGKAKDFLKKRSSVGLKS